MISSKGQANYVHHRANRIYREALVYSVFGQTLSVLIEQLNKLSDFHRYHTES